MQKSIKNIIVPVNFSTSANDAIETGIAMCKRHEATLHLLQVNSEGGFPYPSGKNALLIDMRLEARQANDRAMEKKARGIADRHNITCYYHINEGPFAQTVASVADDFYCDLILLERPASSGLSRFFKPNTAYEVIAEAKCPVLVIPDRCVKTRFDSVLFSVWPSETVFEKLDISLPIIRKDRSKVTLLGSTITRNNITECRLVNSLTGLLESTISKTNTGVERELDPSPRTASKMIRKALEKRSDLVVISASVKKGLKHLFTPSYTEKMVNNCPVPVLSVK